MKDIIRVEVLVKEVLEKIPATRKDDFLLMVNVYDKISPNICELPFALVMCEHKKYRLPAFETISRIRRKLQADHKELRPDEEMIKNRTNKQSDFINYAINGYTPTFMKYVDSQK